MKTLIVGGGQVGSSLGKLLLQNKHTIKIIDSRANIIEKLESEFDKKLLVCADASDPRVLEQAGINDIDILVAATGADETNLIVSILAKMEFGAPKVIARINNPKNAWLFTPAMGVDDAIEASDVLSRLILDDMNTNDLFSLLKLNHGTNSLYSMGIQKQSFATGKSFSEISMPEKSLLISVFRSDESIIPTSDLIFQENDEVLVFSDERHIAEIEKLFC